ncbi:MAG: hypothetical protein GPJ54_01075 [Candidatus Heimdallarchaeota archaeon]|nr:hypothetical protein [Candidatus Heimdallarchaeota archaeon]
MNSKLITKFAVLSLIAVLVFIPVENAKTDSSSLESSSSIVYENPKSNKFSDLLTNFGLLIVALLVAVLAKAIFDYIKIRNQSLLINY